MRRSVLSLKSALAARGATSTHAVPLEGVEKNLILDNDRCIVFEGQHIDLVFRKNTIGYSKPREDATAFEAAKNQKGLQSEGNEFRNVKTP